MDKQDPLDHSLLLGDLVPKMPFTYIKIQPFTRLDSRVTIIPMSMLAFQIFWNWFLTSNQQQTLHESHRTWNPSVYHFRLSSCLTKHLTSSPFRSTSIGCFTSTRLRSWDVVFACHKSNRTQSLDEPQKSALRISDKCPSSSSSSFSLSFCCCLACEWTNLVVGTTVTVLANLLESSLPQAALIL